MKVRPFTSYDLQVVDRIHRSHHESNFHYPSLDRTLRSIVVEGDRREKGGLDSGVIAFGMIRLIPEAIMILDLDQSNVVKVKALKTLIQHAQVTTQMHGYDGFHAFVQGDFAQKLKDNFGFVTCKGEALYLDGDK